MLQPVANIELATCRVAEPPTASGADIHSTGTQRFEIHARQRPTRSLEKAFDATEVSILDLSTQYFDDLR